MSTDRRYVALGVVPDRRLTFSNAAAWQKIQRGPGRRERLARDLRLLARMLVEPRTIAPKAYYRLRNAWRRRRDRLVRRAVLVAANFYSDTAVKSI